MDLAGNVAEWVEARIEPPFQYTAMTKGGSFVLSQPYHFLCAGRVAHPRGHGSIDYIGFRCARDANPDAAAANAPPPPAKPVAREAALDRPAAPDPARYRSRPLEILPVFDLDPQDRYNHHLNCYLPRSVKERDSAGPARPWRIEINAPYLPGDRFAVYFENYWLSGARVLEQSTNAEHTLLEIHGLQPKQREIRLRIQGGLDYVDLTYRVKNFGPQ